VLVLKGLEVYSAVGAFEKIVAIEIALIEESYLLEALSLGLALGYRNLGEALREDASALLSRA